MNKMKIGLFALALLVVGAVSVVTAQSDGEVSEEEIAAREEHQAAHFEKCVEENGEEFCTAMAELRAEHQAERDALFEEYGVEKPVREGHGKGHHRGPPPA